MPSTLVPFEALRPGDHIKITQRIKVGLRVWLTTVTGTVERSERRRGLFTKRSQTDNRSDSNHVRKVPPVRLATSATIFAATASISWSVMVFSRGCSVTAIAIDFLSAAMPSPS